MNAHHLELFYHVAKSKGVSRAVKQMPYGIQQPAVSAQVNALERDLGVTLYERRPFKLTPAGEELFNFVQPFFGRMAEVREKVQGGAQIRIGASPIVFRDHLPAVIETLRGRFPRLGMTLRALNQPDLIAAIEADELDVVISLIPDHVSPAVNAAEIIALPLVLLVPRGSKIKGAQELWKSERIPEPLISLGPSELISQRFQQALTALRVYWPPRIEMDSLDLIEQYVEAGYGIGLSVQMPGKKFSTKTRVLELPGFPTVKLGVLHRAGSKNDGGVRRVFLEEVRKSAARFSQHR